MRYFAWARHPRLSAGSSPTGGSLSRVRYPFRTVSQFELVPAVPGASSVIGNDAGAVTAGFSGAITDAVGAGFARGDGGALRRGRGDAVFVGPVTGGGRRRRRKPG